MKIDAKNNSGHNGFSIIVSAGGHFSDSAKVQSMATENVSLPAANIKFNFISDGIVTKDRPGASSIYLCERGKKV